MANKVSVQLKWNEPAVSLIEKNCVSGLFKMGFDIARAARAAAPYKTGALSNSIRVVENGDVVEIIAGGTWGGKEIRYAAIQEFGGWAGRNHSVFIIGKHYMERAKDSVLSGDYLTRYFGDISR